jgi:hypothetical protein
MVQLLECLNPRVIYTEGGKTLRKLETALAALGAEPLVVVSGRQKYPYIPFQVNKYL